MEKRHKLCPIIKRPPLPFFEDNFSRSYPFWMILDVLKRRGQGAIFAFEIMKKYFLTKKLQPKTFVDMFLPGRFWKYIVLKKKKDIQRH